jgi:hypothetical protein
MKAKERYEMLKGISPNRREEEFIRDLVDNLLLALFIPTQDNLRTLDHVRLEKFNIDFNEPANWASIGCLEVRMFREITEITIDEACPNECPTLCRYIEDFLGFQGYSNILVKTEW